MARMKPWRSQTRWIFVPNPPRERPSAWSDGSCICADFGPPNRRGPPAFFFRPGGRPAGSDDGTVDAPEVVVDLASVIQFVQQRGDDASPGAVLSPPVEGLEGRLPGSIAFREIPPWGAGMEDPEDSIEDWSSVAKRTAGLAVMSTVRQERGDSCPLLVGEIIAAHGRTRGEYSSFRRLCLSIIICLRTIVKQSMVYI